MKSNIELMADNNLEHLREYKLESYIESDNLEQSIQGGDIFMERYLTPEQFNLFKTSANLDDNFQIKQEAPLIEKILKNDVCLIIVRPEMTHYIDAIKDFLEERDFSTVFESTQKLDPYQYWDIYHRGITHPNARYSMATRTIVYTSSYVTAIVFNSPNPQNSSSSADYLFNKLKGNAGVYTENTLRGDLVLKEAKRLGFNNMEMDTTLALAIDPLATYRNLIKESHLPSDTLLTYTSVSIHIPNQEELGRDLSVLFDKEQLKSIINNLQNE